jgi:folylpolyglutamate synthase/dihydropteroate synthase
VRVAPSAEALPAWPEALARAEALAGADGLVVAFGSIFLVGAVRARLLGEPVDPVALQDPAKIVR